MSITREQAEAAAQRAREKIKAETRQQAGQGGKCGAAPSAPGKPLAWSNLSGRQAPPRVFVLSRWIPAQSVTLLHGFGGVGKSLLGQQIGTLAAFKRGFLEGTADACPALGWWGEDDHDEIWRRQEDINAALGISDMTELEGKLYWQACPDVDLTMFDGDEKKFRITSRYDEFRQQIGDTKAKLAILDSSTQVATVNENSRPLVTRCIQTLTGLCIELKTTILLLGHNNRSGDFSGSTAWENRCRARIHMKSESNGEAERQETKLYLPKANYADPLLSNGVVIEWHQGAFRCADQRYETPDQTLDRKMRESAAENVFLLGIEALAARGLHGSHSRQAQNYAVKLLLAQELAKDFLKTELESAMNRLFAKDELQANAEVGRTNRRQPIFGLARKAR